MLASDGYDYMYGTGGNERAVFIDKMNISNGKITVDGPMTKNGRNAI